MPMPQDFLDDVVGFMDRNLVLVNYATDENAGKLTRFPRMKLADAPEGRRAVDKRGNAIGLYVLEEAGEDDAEAFDAFWCPALNNWTGGFGVVVDPGRATVMFTDTMSGCSLGVGSKTPDGQRLVVHLNQEQAAREEEAGTLAKTIKVQEKLQRQLLKEQGAAAMLVEPSKYGGGMTDTGLLYRCTTFGAWNARKRDWAFHMQRYSRRGGVPITYTHAGCKKA